jgi:cell division protein DivIC
MGFLKIINQKRFTIVSIFLFLYIILNLLDGERGLISFYKKQNVKSDLISEKQVLVKKLENVKKRNNLLTNPIDLDYLEILYREKFLAGKSSEKIYVNK